MVLVLVLYCGVANVQGKDGIQKEESAVFSLLPRNWVFLTEPLPSGGVGPFLN